MTDRPRPVTKMNHVLNGCGCGRTKCLKFYCHCFASETPCGKKCYCKGCKNDLAYWSRVKAQWSEIEDPLPDNVIAVDNKNDNSINPSSNDDILTYQSEALKSEPRREKRRSLPAKASVISNADRGSKKRSSLPSNLLESKRRGRPPKDKSRSVQNKQMKKYGPAEDRTCPFCKKVFSIKTGLAYHIENKVCQRESDVGKVNESYQPFHQLQPGELFITEFGVVQVLVDNRLPNDFGSTLVGESEKQASKEWKRKLKSLLTQKEKLVRKRMFNEKLKELGDDPMEPRDSYPTRIVECLEVHDERQKYTDLDVKNGKGRLSTGRIDKIIEDAVRVATLDTEQETTTKTNTRMYLNRNLLTTEYNSSVTIYCCSVCGKSDFTTIAGLTYHIGKHTDEEDKEINEKVEDDEDDISYESKNNRKKSRRRAALKGLKKIAETYVDNLEDNELSNNADDTAFVPNSENDPDPADDELDDDIVKGEGTDDNDDDDDDDDDEENESKTFKKKFVQVRKKRPPEDIDVQEIVDDCNTGRYFTMKPYHGEHDIFCKLCRTTEGRRFCCQYCKQTNHIECLKREMTIINWHDKSDFLCGNCIRIVLGRRRRAARRLAKAQRAREQKARELEMLKRRADDGDQDAIRKVKELEDKVKPKKGSKKTKLEPNDDKAEVALITKDKSLPSLQSEENSTKKKRRKCTDVKIPGTTMEWETLEKPRIIGCPEGGPGGLICCASCALAYSSTLDNTTDEFDAQVIARIGEEVEDLRLLLEDAEKRLEKAIFVAQENETRRLLIQNDMVQAGPDSSSFLNGSTDSSNVIILDQSQRDNDSNNITGASNQQNDDLPKLLGASTATNNTSDTFDHNFMEV